MQNEIDYTLQYQNWHKDNPYSKNFDIKIWKELINLHNIHPQKEDSRILELGCGLGRFLLALRDYGYTNLKGIDINKDFVQATQSEGLDAEVSDAVKYLEQTNTTYDTIYCFDILEHIEKEKQPKFFKLLKEHLDEKGFAVIRVPNALSPTANYFRYEDFTHVISYTPVTIEFLCKNAGLNHVIIRPEVEESQRLRTLKAPFAEIYKEQFSLDDIILTPNILAVIFKSKESFDKYITDTKPLVNDYKFVRFEGVNLKTILKYYLSKLCQKFSFGPLRKYFDSKLPKKYKIAVLEFDSDEIHK